jgi:microcystin-dependent protein
VGTPFIGEIKLISFNFAPKGWAFCNGQLLPINQNQALFSILGTTYGGDGRVNFALPDLRGRMPMHVSQGHALGQRGGQEAHTLLSSQMPAHIHVLQGTLAPANPPPAGTVTHIPAGNMLALATTDVYTTVAADLTSMAPDSITSIGGSQPHENRQPFLALGFVIALLGVFPSQN